MKAVHMGGVVRLPWTAAGIHNLQPRVMHWLNHGCKNVPNRQYTFLRMWSFGCSRTGAPALPTTAFSKECQFSCDPVDTEPKMCDALLQAEEHVMKGKLKRLLVHRKGATR